MPTTLNLTAILMLTTAALADMPGDRAVESPWTTRYFDTHLDMQLDLDWIAVQSADLSNDHITVTGGPTADLSKARSGSVHQWFYVPVTDAATPQDIADIVVAVSAIDNTFASPIFLGGTHNLPWIPTSELIVQLRDGHTLEGVTIIDHDLGEYTGMTRIATAATTGLDTLRLVEEIAQHPSVEWAQPNAIWWAKHFYVPNDPNYASQWALNNSNDMDMDAPECWDTIFGDASIIVSILDDGIDQNHADISQVPGEDFTNENTGGHHTMICDGHGSCVSGCIAATIDNNIGISGVAPGCRVMATRIFNAIDFFTFCLGFIETTDAWIVNGIGWAVNNGARVTNSSWGGGSPSSSVTTAFNNAEAAGVIHFGAAGNDGSSNISYPASLASLNAISAINSSGNLASFSTYGNGLFACAPGEGILTTDWSGSNGFGNGDWVTIDGTSFASPYSAGVAALILSVDPTLTPDEVEDIMAATATDRGSNGYDTQYGWGIVNAAAAVAAVDTGPECPTDINGDGMTGADDILAVIADWGCAGCPSDIDGDGYTGTNDLLAVIASWGPCN